jgi:hypothetical protein
MTNTQERLAALQFEITALRAQLAELAHGASDDRQCQFLFRELVYAVATYNALLRKHGRQPASALRQRAVNQLDQPIYR